MPSGPVRRPPHELAFAAAIRAARVEAGRTQADVAEQAGPSVRVVQRAEQGQRRINGEAATIAQSLGRSLDELVRVSAAAIASGPNFKAVQKMLGHASASMTLSRYRHLLGDELDVVAERLDVAARDAGVPPACPEATITPITQRESAR